MGDLDSARGGLGLGSGDYRKVLETGDIPFCFRFPPIGRYQLVGCLVPTACLGFDTLMPFQTPGGTARFDPDSIRRRGKGCCLFWELPLYCCISECPLQTLE